MRKSVAHLREFASNAGTPKDIAVEFDFFAMPVALEGDGRVERMIVERTRLDADLRSVPTGERYVIPCRLVVACIGYQTPPIAGVPYEHGRGRFANDEGRILPGLYCVGWARRGPSGTIGTNRPDGFAIVDLIAEDITDSSSKFGRPALDALLEGHRHFPRLAEYRQGRDRACPRRRSPGKVCRRG
jgi:ferredoxin--NADP+ reductase